FIHPKDAYSRAKAMLQKALEIDDTLSEAYSSLAFMIHGYEWDFPAAEKYLLRSLELNPSNSYAHGWYAEMLASVGRHEEAITEAKKAIESDPLFSLVRALYGIVLSIAGRIEDGRAQLLKAISMNPDQPMPYLFIGMMYLIRPTVPEKAIEYLEKAVGFGITFAYGWLGMAYAAASRRDETLKILAKLDKIEQENYLPPYKKVGFYLKPGLKHFRFMKKKYVAPLLRAVIYLGLNRQEEALEYLEKSSQARDYFFVSVLLLERFSDLPWFEEFTSSQRFKTLQEKFKLE
ncbi:MAG: tetratricopeptide repeat protein, partial [Candidatus Aminicenantes bacterium]|nr:tetratricopeptide repeat protein [Candidatus Aminicenantes bacterium]